jgi:Flp pilus assembly pilin Flp
VAVPARRLKSAAGDESGAAIVEYGLMVALIALLALASVGKMGHLVRSVFNEVKDAIEVVLDT